MQHTSKLDHAKSLANHSLSIIPVNAGDKVPCVKWTPYTSRLATEDELKQWFSPANDNRNIGIVTGAVSGVVVVDVDKPEAFHMDMPRTPTARTGKGFHYYFKHPGFDVGNVKLPFGDLKADGGFVVAPPSIHANGNAYKWLDGLSFDDVELAELPSELVALAYKPEPANDNELVQTTAYGKAWLKDVERLANTRDGNRNNKLNEVACKAGSLHVAGQLNRQEAIDAMLLACRSNGLMHDRENGGLTRVTATIMSGFDTGMRNPREVSSIEVDDTPPPPGKLVAHFASEINAEAVPWLWKPVLVSGAITFLAGEAGQGKSTIAYDIAARVSNGDRFPASEDSFRQGKVIYMSNEDQGSYLIRPRLEAAGADLDEVIICSGVSSEHGERNVDLIADIKQIEELLAAHRDVSLIILDPFNDYLGKSDINDMGQTKRLLAPINRLAKNCNVAILIVHHFNKGSGGKASNRMSGSTALRSTARTVFFVERDPVEEDVRIMVCDKNNYANDRTEYRCTIKLMDLGGGVEATYLEWDNETFKRSSDEVLLDSLNAPQRRKCIELIQSLFAEAGTDTLDAASIRKAAEGAGIYPQVLYDAQRALKIEAELDPTDSRKRIWKLPKAA